MNSSINGDDKSFLGKFVLFADDTNIFVSAPSEKEVYKKANVLVIKSSDKDFGALYFNSLKISINEWYLYRLSRLRILCLLNKGFVCSSNWPMAMRNLIKIN